MVTTGRVSSLALMFYAYDLTGSTIAMAILAMAQTLPVVVFAGFVGVYVDQWNRKTIMVASDVIRAITILLIPLTVYFPSFMPTIYWVYLLTFIYATANAWFFLIPSEFLYLVHNIMCELVFHKSNPPHLVSIK
jgi:hypothetical protein